MIDYHKLGKYLDNIYTGATDNSSRKIVTSLNGDVLTLEFRSIVNVARNEELAERKMQLESEALELIKKKKDEIVKCYNAESDVNLKLKEQSKSKVQNSSFELLTFSPISPVRTYKFSCCKCFDLS